MNEWKFPLLNYGKKRGYGDGGEENFKDDIIKALVREICQNSLDAVNDKSSPVTVEFALTQICKSKVPNREKLLMAIDGGIRIWEKDEDERVIEMLNSYRSILNSTAINVMRISDFNTIGLNGVDSETSTPWNALVKRTGCSNKSSSAGGSYGLGKQAAFACSDLKTIFYSTFNQEGIHAYQGTGEYPTLNIDNEDTQGTVYYSSNDQNHSIKEKINITDFERNETGTDIYILAFKDIKNIQKKFIVEVIENFLLSIHNEKLVVNVMGEIINKEKLNQYIKYYQEDYDYAPDYYKVLTSDKSIEYNYELDMMGDEGNIKLTILQDKSLNNTIYLSRSIGMKIRDKNRLNNYMPFSAILEVNGEKASNCFRDMENVQHNKWQPNFSRNNAADAKKRLDELETFIKKTLTELNPTYNQEELDIYGLGEFLPDDLSLNDEQIKAKESITDKIVNEVKVKRVNHRTAKDIYQSGLEESSGDTSGDGEQTELGQGVPKGKTHQKSNNKSEVTEGEGETPILKRNKIDANKLRIIGLENSGEYLLMFQPTKNIKNAEIEIYVKGEASKEMLKVSNAYIKKSTLFKKKLKIDKDNVIKLNDINMQTQTNINFKLETNRLCSMEVNIYEFE